MSGFNNQIHTLIHRFDMKEANSRKSGDIINIETQDGIWSLNSVKLFFKASILAGAANVCSFPRNLGSIIETLTVFIDDIEIQHIKNYNQLARIMNDYTKDQFSTNVLGNDTPISNTVSNTVYNFALTPCCIDAFYGILSSHGIIKGKLRIQINLAPDNILLRPDSNAYYQLDETYMTIKSDSEENLAKIENQSIEFDNFVSMMQQNITFNQQTNVFLNSRYIHYVLGTFLKPGFDTLVSTTANLGTSQYFLHGTNDETIDYKISVNFSVNNIPLSTSVIPYNNSVEYLDTIFNNTGAISYPVYLNRDGTISTRNITEVLAYQWISGLPIDIKNNDKTLNISFNSTSAGNAKSNYSLIFVKCNSLLELNTNTNTYILTK